MWSAQSEDLCDEWLLNACVSHGTHVLAKKYPLPKGWTLSNLLQISHREQELLPNDMLSILTQKQMLGFLKNKLDETF